MDSLPETQSIEESSSRSCRMYRPGMARFLRARRSVIAARVAGVVFWKTLAQGAPNWRLQLLAESRIWS